MPVLITLHSLLALDEILHLSIANMLRSIRPCSSHIIRTCVNRGSMVSFILAIKAAMVVKWGLVSPDKHIKVILLMQALSILLLDSIPRE